MTDQPFKDSAKEYLALGFHPLPVTGKFPPVVGATGNGGTVTPEKVKAWRKSHGGLNVGLRHEGTIGIDVDVYGDKHGDEELAALVEELGPLPKTFSTTARGKKSPSRQYLYRVTEGDRFATKLGSAIEIIQRHHRYTVVHPSVHPELGEPYRWYGPDGKKRSGPPHLDEIPDLPEAWVRYLTAAPLGQMTDAPVVDFDEFLGALPAGVACYATEKLGEEIAAVDAASHVGHDEAHRFLLRGAMMGREGHAGVEPVLRDLLARYRRYLDSARPREAEGEITRLVEAVSMVAQRKVLEDSCRCSNHGPLTILTDEEIAHEAKLGPLLHDKKRTLLTETARVRFLADHPVKRYADSQGAAFVWVDGAWRTADVEEIAYLWLSARIGDEMTAAKGKELAKAAMMHAEIVDDSALDRRYISFTNGLLDWTSGELTPRTPEVFVTAHLPIAWRPAASLGRFEDWISSTFDREMIPNIWELIGYALSPVHDLKVAVALHGMGGGGKSVLMNIFGSLVGARLSAYIAPQQMGDRFNRALLHGKHLNIAADVGAETMRNLGTWKSMIAADVISAEFKGRDGFAYRPNAFNVASFNTLPASESNDSGFWDRWLVLLFTKRFNGDGIVEDNYYRDEMHLDAAVLEGIAVEAVSALRRLRARGTFDKAAFLPAKNAWRSEVDGVAAFAEERIVVDPSGIILASTVHKFYEKLERDGGGQPRNARTFYRELGEYLKEKHPGKVERKLGNGHVNYFFGLKIVHRDADLGYTTAGPDDMYGKHGWVKDEARHLRAV